ncbi:MAG TPA: hypothetical protein VHE30_19570 [Polyangiaceae bacterium]|nr:hypothetical protein [Polyangiaceae bacterium]
MQTQGVITVIAEIAPERVPSLVSLLGDLSRALTAPPGQSAPIVDFRTMESVHFARFAVLPEDSKGRRHLAFSSAYDGPRGVHLSELVSKAQPGLVAIFEHCVGFPERARIAKNTLLGFIEEKSIRHGALHVGYVGRSVQDVQREDALRKFIEEKLDANPPDGRSALRVRDQIREWVKKSEFAWALEPRQEEISPLGVDGFWSALGWIATLVGVVVGGGILAAAFGPVALALYGAGLGLVGGAILALLRYHELTEPAKTDSDISHGFEHQEEEDVGIRNQLTHLVDVKPGPFRYFLLKTVLHAVELRARFEFYTGDLGGIETIHCAHWCVLEGENDAKPRLLFFSNYDGSWERYLGDFIEEAGGGMTSVWSNTVNYPRARFLLWDGATNERVFKAWTRESQVHTDVWYRANPDVSIRNINDNSRLRDGLSGPMSEDEAKRWLMLL